MEYRHLVVHREGHVLTCALSNPPAHTLNFRMLRELHDLLDRIEDDEEIRVFAVTGAAEGVFLYWFDLQEMSSIARSDDEEAASSPAELTPIQELGLRIEELRPITVAALNGYTGGGACELALSFDFRLMADGHYTFALPQTSFGLVPAGGGAWHCLRALGTARALDVLLHGEFMTPRRAYDLGLLSRLLPEEDFREEACRFCAHLAQRAPLALQGVKRLIRRGMSLGQREFYAMEARELARVIRSEDVRTALAAWIANPDPAAYRVSFKGR